MTLSVEQLKQQLQDFQPSPERADDLFGQQCCKLALRALEQGSYGIGALLLDGQGQVLVQAHNAVFADGFDSSAHAEMVLLDRFERRFPDYGDRGDLTLMVSLEPCPMCLTRSLLAGIGQLKYLAEDRQGGMVRQIQRLPPVWRNLSQLQYRRRARVSPALTALAGQLATCGIEQLRHKLLTRIR